MSELSWDFTFHDAIDGRNNSKLVANHYDSERNKYVFKRGLSLAEVACYLGHRRIWQNIAKGDANFALVLEDDACISDELKAFIQLLSAKSDHFKEVMIKLDAQNKDGEIISSIGNVDLFISNKLPSGTAGYILGKVAAQNLLQNTSEYVARPVDMDLKHYWEHKVLILLPSRQLVDVPEDKSGSSLETERNQQKTTSMLRRFIRNYKYQANMRRNRALYPIETLKGELIGSFET